MQFNQEDISHSNEALILSEKVITDTLKEALFTGLVPKPGQQLLTEQGHLADVIGSPQFHHFLETYLANEAGDSSLDIVSAYQRLVDTLPRDFKVDDLVEVVDEVVHGLRGTVETDVKGTIERLQAMIDEGSYRETGQLVEGVSQAHKMMSLVSP